ncbi:hypothetical protein Lal_00044011 [Lupinus albus]|uniref:Uncharacterized protein n=1 Tax=Lupinus albus TaxID=3870 RepID=A0A6A5PEB7_LUPAL|nr:hypothetical protein Lalb_Chr15g0090801 [Lupinus albus]KAF1895362.1 hypothetical protein Lal_00044011 [Lupinus albus]
MDRAIPRCRSLLFFLLCSSLHFISGFPDESPGSKDASKTEAHAHNTSSIILIVLIVLFVLSLLSFLLFKLWRKKKREEQYARLLKLFEEDDELELELGLRD